MYAGVYVHMYVKEMIEIYKHKGIPLDTLTDKDSEIAGQQGWSCLHMMADKNTGCLKKKW